MSSIRATSLAAKILLALIRGYQFTLSALMGKQCRFYPSCSHYAADAIRHYGALRGGFMGARRILRCHPWNLGGYDPVPLPDFYSEKGCNCVIDAPEAKNSDAAHPAAAPIDTPTQTER
jgi:putative membrane protein insertion efficiency factor